MGWHLWILVALFGILVGGLERLEIPEEEGEALLTEKSVALAKSRAKVFTYLSDLRTFTEWFPGMTSFEATDTAPMSVGKHFTLSVYSTIFGENQYDVVLTGYESPRYISFLSDDWMSLRTEVSVERRESSTAPTLLTFKRYANKRSLLFRYILLPVLKMYHNHEVRAGLFNLRFVFQR